MSEPKVKGLAFRSVMRSLASLRGEAAVKSAYEAMPTVVAEALRYGEIIATGWYPVAWYREMFAGIVSVTSSSTPKEIGAESIRADMNGVHKVLLRVLSPHTILSVTPKLFVKYYDTGRLEIPEARQGYTRALYTGCVGWDQNMWAEILGSSEMMLELAGAANIRSRVLAGGQDRDEHFELEVYWT